MVLQEFTLRSTLNQVADHFSHVTCYDCSNKSRELQPAGFLPVRCNPQLKASDGL